MSAFAEQQQKKPQSFFNITPQQEQKQTPTNVLDEILRFIEELSFNKTLPTFVCLDHLNPLFAFATEQQIYKFFQRLIALVHNQQVTVMLMLHTRDKNDTIAAANERFHTGLVYEHEDEDMENNMANVFEQASDMVFRVKGLPTGYSKDVHGLVNVIAKLNNESCVPQIKTLHYKTMDYSVRFFVPGAGAQGSKELF